MRRGASEAPGPGADGCGGDGDVTRAAGALDAAGADRAADAASTAGRERSPPGRWRLLAPALFAWGVVATVTLCAGTWPLLVGVALIFNAVVLICLLLPGKPRAVASSAIRIGGIAAALLLILGVRIGAEEAIRLAPALVSAAQSSTRVEFIGELAGYPSLEPGPGADSGAAQPTEAGSRVGGGVGANAGRDTAVGADTDAVQRQRSDSGRGMVSGWVKAAITVVVPVGGATAGAAAGTNKAPSVSQPVPVVLWLQDISVGCPGVPATDCASGWSPGVTVRGSGTLVPLEPTSDAAFGVSVERMTQTAAARGGQAFATSLRMGLVAATIDKPHAKLVPGFAVGDTSLVNDDLQAALRASSLLHLLAVSGANCALVTSVALWAVSWLGAGRRLRVCVAALMLFGFVVVVGPDASVQRAAVMGAVMLVSGFGGKRSVSFAALGVAVAVLLIIDPWQAWAPGFALSVAATAGIMALAPPLQEIAVRRLRVPGWIALPFAVAFAAQLACGPLLLLLDDGLPAVGVLANVVAAPAAPLGTGLGLLAMLAAPVSEPLANAVVSLAALPSLWVEHTAALAAGLPLARLAWPGGPVGAAMLLSVELAIALAWLLARGALGGAGSRRFAPWKPPAAGARRLRFAVALLVGLALGVFAGPTAVVPTVQRIATPKGWAVVACDVGQGDALLLRGEGAARGEAMLIDTGNEPRKLRECLSRFGVSRISLLVLTHDDKDHVGALTEVIGAVDAVLVAPANLEDRDDRPLLRALQQASVPVAETHAGASGIHAGVEWHAMAPSAGHRPLDRNGASIVLMAEARGIHTLLLADTGEEEQAAMLRAQPPDPALNDQALRADVVKVAHHGSRDQLPEIYRRAGATFALLSVGLANSFGHPHADTLATLKRAGTLALRTDELGSIAVTPGQNGPEVWSARKAESSQ